jgi:hypothetical protein
MSMQWDSPEEGIGMFITYFRNADTFTAQLRGLDPDAEYIVHNRDNPDEKYTMTGEALMGGSLKEIAGKTNEAIVYEYRLAQGQDTSEFQTAKVETGPGSTDFDPSKYTVSLFDIEMPTATKAYGLTDGELKALYTTDPSADHECSFVTVDFRSTGGIYQISKDIYGELQYAGSPLFDGWSMVNRDTLFFELGGTRYPNTHWDTNTAQFRLFFLTKEIEGTYFLWFFNSIPLADSDGAWTNGPKKIMYQTAGGVEKQFVIDVHIFGSDTQSVFPYSADQSGNGSIFKISEEMYGSFAYTGKGCSDAEDLTWAQIEAEKIGNETEHERAAAEANVDG